MSHIKKAIQKTSFLSRFGSLLLFISLLAYSCANKGAGPQGGAKDETPPKILKTVPENGSTNFNKKQIQITFDENVTLDKVAQYVVISPPQNKAPIIRANAKLLTAIFEDDFLDNTTYTIDFGNAIVDLNEKNPLRNYRFAFATGDEIDTLQISGNLINAQDLNPYSGVFIGIYNAEENDSAFLKKPFMRIAKTDETGRFTIDNIKEGKYKLYALGDANRDYFYQIGEGLAFTDSIFTPTASLEQKIDTLWKDSLTIDTIMYTRVTRFRPDDIVLRYFVEDKKRQYYIRYERKNPEAFSLYFNTTATELPKVKPLNFDWDEKYILQKNNTLDTLTYWLTDSTIWNIDTLKLEMTYLKSDSIMQLSPWTDTLSVVFRKLNPRAKPKDDNPVEFYNFNTNARGTFEVYNPLTITFQKPLEKADLSMITLSEKVDTTFKKLRLNWRAVDSTKMSYIITHKWEPEKSYQLQVDSAAFWSIYGMHNNAYKGNFKIRSLAEYTAVNLFLEEFEPQAVFQVLDTKDKVVATKPAKESGTLIEYLKPGDYYIRMFIDSNENGEWDTGDLTLRRQPEEVIYFQRKLTLMANWTHEEIFDHKELSPLKQKPEELMKDAGAQQSKK